MISRLGGTDTNPWKGLSVGSVTGESGRLGMVVGTGDWVVGGITAGCLTWVGEAGSSIWVVGHGCLTQSGSCGDRLGFSTGDGGEFSTGDDGEVGLQRGNDSYFRKNFLFLSVIRPDPSIRTRY